MQLLLLHLLHRIFAPKEDTTGVDPHMCIKRSFVNLIDGLRITGLETDTGVIYKTDGRLLSMSRIFASLF